MKTLFYAIWNLLRKIEGAIMIVTAVILVSLILVQVALRYVFKLPLMGVEELACMTGFWMYMVGAASGARERNHIKADLVNSFVKNQRVSGFIQSIVSLVTVVLACTMTSWCWNYVQWSLKAGEKSPALMIPMVYAQFSLLVASSLMAFYFFIEFIDHVRKAAGFPPLALPDTSNDQ